MTESEHLMLVLTFGVVVGRAVMDLIRGLLGLFDEETR